VIPYDLDDELPGMLDDPSGEVDEGEAYRLHPLCHPGTAEGERLHGHVEVEGKDREPPPRGILPKVARRELPPCEVVFHDGMGFFTLTTAFIGKGYEPFSCPLHVGNERIELVLHPFIVEGLERKFIPGRTGCLRISRIAPYILFFTPKNDAHRDRRLLKLI
jgi:hypothetical protein